MYGLIPKPQPYIDWQGHLVEPKLTCEICGEPGEWHAEYFGATMVLGRIACDGCFDHLHAGFLPPISEKTSDTEYLKQIAEKLRSANRIILDPSPHEGNKVIQISDELANQIAAELDTIAKRLEIPTGKPQ